MDGMVLASVVFLAGLGRRATVASETEDYAFDFEEPMGESEDQDGALDVSLLQDDDDDFDDDFDDI